MHTVDNRKRNKSHQVYTLSKHRSACHDAQASSLLDVSYSHSACIINLYATKKYKPTKKSLKRPALICSSQPNSPSSHHPESQVNFVILVSFVCFINWFLVSIQNIGSIMAFSYMFIIVFWSYPSYSLASLILHHFCSPIAPPI